MITGPWALVVPITAKVSSSHRGATNERWVSRRWNPTVMPKPLTAYMSTRAIRSGTRKPLPHVHAAAPRIAAAGSTTAARLAYRCAGAIGRGGGSVLGKSSAADRESRRVGSCLVDCNRSLLTSGDDGVRVDQAPVGGGDQARDREDVEEVGEFKL